MSDGPDRWDPRRGRSPRRGDLSAATLAEARDVIALYPEPRSALIPLCHLAQRAGRLADARGHG